MFFGFNGPISTLVHNVLVALTFITACIVLVEFIPYRGVCTTVAPLSVQFDWTVSLIAIL